jgi:hypothetical protein
MGGEAMAPLLLKGPPSRQASSHLTTAPKLALQPPGGRRTLIGVSGYRFNIEIWQANAKNFGEIL